MKKVEQVIRDSRGRLINIGAWEYMVDTDPDTGVAVTHNPLPAGAAVTYEDVVTRGDGARFLATDPRAYEEVLVDD